ncbi:hypothetical protein L211DRAFT_852919 [Terfezia boudieri ATCC MYA-4762]|uniref:Uncharacterized protein n=1 Tax=Terfezia boudieri ATCC MYA-4762 TaxID=1051890 RepID=A0A3N4LA27_9PEZI|nr:hypothetical protein L211DRAFT_852919 [Terfezia boudieri ATCC MYA-4762]
MNTSLETPNIPGQREWAPRQSTCSTGSSGSNNNKLSDTSVYSQSPSNPNTQAMVDMVEGIDRSTRKVSSTIVWAVGNKQRIREFVYKIRQNKKAATKFRSMTIREIAILIFTYIGYESVPRLRKTRKPDFDDYDSTGYFITRNDYTRFIYCEVSLVARTLQLANTNDTHTLLKFTKSAILNSNNATVPTITLSDALEAISWLENTSLTKVSTTLGWTVATAQDVSVFVTAARKLLPPFALQPGFTLTKANSEVQLKDFVLYARERNTTLMRKARAWGVRALAAKNKKISEQAKKDGLVPPVQHLNTTASKEETKPGLEQLKKGTEAELEQLKGQLDALKGIISILLEGHPRAEEIGAQLQNI